jgi:hypothetical protein
MTKLNAGIAATARLALHDNVDTAPTRAQAWLDGRG